MNTTAKNQIKKDDLSVMEELLHQANYQISELDAICPAYVSITGMDVEFEVYPPGESYPYYFRIHYYLFSELLEEWYYDNDVDSDVVGMKNDDGDPVTAGYWYTDIASEKAQLEVTNYVIQKLFKSIF